MTHVSNALARPKRWAVLGAYAVVVGVSQMLWLNFAPLLTLVQSRYGVSELTASQLVLVFPLLYVVLSVPAGALTDRRGYRVSVGLGALVMALFAVVRVFDQAFWPLLAGQIGIAIAQPFILNGISKLVSDWFAEEQSALATGLGTMGMFVGMAVGMAWTPALVTSMGLRGAMIVFAVLTSLSGLVFMAVVRPNEMRVADKDASSAGFGPLLRDRTMWLLFVLSLLGLGVFNGLTTWLEQILAPHGIDAEQAGLVGGAILGGGIIGAIVIPALSDFSKRRKPYLLVSVLGALATLYPLCTSGSYSALLFYGGLHGFFFLPAFALLLDMCAFVAGARSAGAATSLVTLTGNAGGVLVALAVPLVKGRSHDFESSILMMVALLALALVLAFFVPETFVVREAVAEAR